VSIDIILNKKNVGKRIRKLRGDMNQRDFAKLSGFTQPYLSGVEIGRVKPSLDFLFFLCDFCDTTMDYILRGKL